jgi:hypothetical protein
MKSAGPLMVAVALLLAAVARAQDTPDAAAPDPTAADKPYASIVARNMFGLLPIPPPAPELTNPPAEPPPKITPNGIMDIFGHLEALFKVATKPKPGQPPKDDAYVLREGQRQDDIEIVKINKADGLITFNNHGTIQELPLLVAKDAAPAAGPGGAPGMRPGNPALGGSRPAPMSPEDRAAQRAGRQVQRGSNPGNPNPNVGASAGQPSLGASNFQPQNNLNSQPQSIEDQVMNAAKEMALIEQNRIATQQEVDAGRLPPLPPTLLTPPEVMPSLIANGPEVPPPPTTTRK